MNDYRRPLGSIRFNDLETLVEQLKSFAAKHGNPVATLHVIASRASLNFLASPDETGPYGLGCEWVNGPHALHAQTTAPEADSSGESARMPHLAGLNRCNVYDNQVVMTFDTVEQAAAAHRMIDYPGDDANDSGKSGRVAQFGGSGTETTTGTENALYGADKGGTRDAMHGEAMRSAFVLSPPSAEMRRAAGEWPTWQAHERARAPLDPSPEEQRARFEAIARTPRPTAVEVKELLDRIAYHWAAVDHWDGAVSSTLNDAARIIDRLGVEVVKLELERDDLARQLERIAANAKPIAGTDVARLVERARRVSEGMQEFDSNSMRKAEGRLIDELVAALNDRVRRCGVAEEALGAATRDMVNAQTQARHDREHAGKLAARIRVLEGEQTIHVCGCRDVAGDIVGEAYAVLATWIAHGTSPGDERWSSLTSKLRWEIITARRLIDESAPVVKWVQDIATMTDTECDFADVGAIRAQARGTFKEPPPVQRFYGEDDRAMASRLVSLWTGGPGSTAQDRVQNIGTLVDRIASEAFGLERGQ